MSTAIAGVVKNGVIVPTAPLPEGAQVEIRVKVESAVEELAPATRVTPAELRKLPREERQLILAKAAEIAENDYRTDKELTGFEAFSEEEISDDEPDAN